jgi:predicted amidohydrolase
MKQERVAALQMCSGPDVGANLAQAQRLIAEAAARGAKLAVLPENFALMGRNERDKLAVAEREGEGPIQAFLAEQARRHGLWLVGGTIGLRGSDPERVRAACLLYSDRGERVARYDKIHLFDVEVGEREAYRESATLEPGAEPVLVDTPVGRLGLAVCYDLRFPELFRRLAGQGMQLLALPAAFTATTGAAHWEVLLRARAIENLCYVVASAQGGMHANGRATYGHSMVIDPWGKVLAELGTEPGTADAAIDPAELAQLRERFPALSHRRM